MTVAAIPFVLAVAALCLNMVLFGSDRRRLYAALDALPEDVRHGLTWPRPPAGLGDRLGHEERRRATARLAIWSLPQAPAIPPDVYGLERAYRQTLRRDDLLIVAAVLAFALAAKGAWMISIVGLVGYGALIILRRRLIAPWPQP
ncbi:MAG: hypothetical protein AAGK00_19450 [Pseudomonadota bacterium]